MTVILTAAQRAVVTHPARHLLVDAGAGTGKTTTLVQAICHRLGLRVGEVPGAASPVALAEVAAITFTNLAAADLQRKLRGALRAAGRRDLAAEVDVARVGTIHGFCADLLRTHGLAAGVRPAARVLGDGEATALAELCAREAVVAAVEQRDVSGLDALFAGRKLRDVIGLVARLSADADRLTRWGRFAGHRPHEAAVLDLAARAAAGRLDRLVAEGALDFDRMLTAVRDLLRDDARARHAVQRATRLLVVDEFQDVDPVQREIAELVGGLAMPSDPAPAALLLVGDPKQSIYRFRRADVSVWNEVAAEFASVGGDRAVVPLDENFRSVPAVLACADHLLAPRFAGTGEGGALRPFEVAYRSLRPTVPALAARAGVECWCIAARDDGKARGAEEVRAIEAAALAARVHAMVAAGEAEPGDVAVVLAAWGAAAAYEAALRAAGIPVLLLRGEGFWEAREVLDGLLALRAVRDPSDDVALAGFLKGPMAGLRDDTLVAIARARRAGEAWWDALPRVDAERERLGVARERLARWAALRDRVPHDALLVEMLEETGYFAFAASLGAAAPQAVANLRKLLRVIGQRGDQALGDVLREVAELRARGDREAPERLVRGRGDAVTIVSIHGAKGLEWPVVIWADLVRAAAPDANPLVALRDRIVLRAAAEATAAGEPAEDAAYEAARVEAEAERAAERWRLWYVAMTRAQRLLVLSGIPLGDGSRAKGSPALAVREALGLGPGVTEAAFAGADGVAHRAVVREFAEAMPAEAAVGDVPVPIAVRPEPVRVPAGSCRLSATALAAAVRSGRERIAAERAARTEAGQEAVARGQAVHAVLERYDPDGEGAEALMEEAVAEWFDGAATADAVRDVRSAVEAAARHPRWQAIARGRGAARELPFTWFAGGGTVISGALDLVAWEGEAVRVLDVKTTSAGAAEVAVRYAVQASVYAEAVQAIAGAALATFEVLVVPAGEVVEVRPDEGVAALVARVRAGGE